MRYSLLTHPGLGPFVADELSIYDCRIIRPGFIIVEGDISSSQILELRSVQYAKELLGLIIFSNENTCDDDLFDQLKKFDFSFVDKPFRVTVKRHFSGNMSFKTVDIERRLVCHIEEQHQAVFSLRKYEINLRLDLFCDGADFGIALHDKELCKRFQKPYNFSNAIKGNLAHVMCRMGQIERLRGETIIDIFSGSATLLLEALALSPCQDNTFIAIDRSAHAVVGATQNLQANYQGRNWSVVAGDVLQLSSLVNEVSLILADPPFGRHMGKKLKFARFFGYLLSEVRKVLKTDGRLVIRVMKKDSFLRVANEIRGLELERMVEVNQGGFNSYLICLKKTEQQARI